MLSTTLRRWLVPALAAITVMAGGVAVRAVGALARPELPAMTAEQLLVAAQTALHTSQPGGFSGTVSVRADLGLPEGLTGLAGSGGQSGAPDFGSLLAGTHTLKVWAASPGSLRVAITGKLTESSFITNGRDVWTWSSRDNAATHSTRPQAGPDRKRDDKAPMTPDKVAAAVLAAIGPSTEVTTSATDRVAGRSVYELILAPRDTASLIGRVSIAIDSEQKTPLRVRVIARNATQPAFEIGFTEIDFARPADSWFTFSPPAGAKVTEKPAGAQATTLAPLAPFAAIAGLGGVGGVGGGGTTSVGEGWTRVTIAKVPFGANHSGRDDISRLLRRLPRTDGGRVLSGSLFTALLTDDGRLLFGAVTPERLAQVAAQAAKG